MIRFGLAASALAALLLAAPSAQAQFSGSMCVNPSPSVLIDPGFAVLIADSEKDCHNMCNKMGATCTKIASANAKCDKAELGGFTQVEKLVCNSFDPPGDCRDAVKVFAKVEKDLLKEDAATEKDNCKTLRADCHTACDAGPPPLP